MKNIEVEIKCFISKEKYEELLIFFNKNADFVNEDDQETYYFDAEHDLRIQKNNSFSKIVLFFEQYSIFLFIIFIYYFFVYFSDYLYSILVFLFTLITGLAI